MDTPDLYDRLLQERKFRWYRFSLWTLLVFVLLPAERIEGAEPAQIAAELKKDAVAAQSKSGSRKKKDDENTSSAPVKPAAPKPPVKPRLVLHLQNGSTISGRLAIKQITLETRYGTLTIPIEKIKSITPGLGSNNSQLGAKLSALVEKLGSEVFAERETGCRCATS